MPRFPQPRSNFAERTRETWQPPVFVPPDTTANRLLARVRRFLDLQAASIWNDMAMLLPHAQGVVIDVGCGAQPYRGLLPPATTYLGLDTAAARERFGYEIPGVVYFEGETWPVASESADLVLATETLEHVATPAHFLAEACRVLKPGGSLILTVPFAARWHFIPYDYWRFTPASLGELLRAARFNSLEVYARGNEWTVAAYKQTALILPLLMPQGKSTLAVLLLRIAAIPLLPLLLVLAGIGQISLRCEGGDDCLGYTVIAQKSEPAAAGAAS